MLTHIQEALQSVTKNLLAINRAGPGLTHGNANIPIQEFNNQQHDDAPGQMDASPQAVGGM